MKPCQHCGQLWLNHRHVCAPTAKTPIYGAGDAAKPKTEDRTLIILANGSRHRWVYFTDELVHDGRPTSLARGYAPTDRRVPLKQVWPFDTSKWAGHQCWVWQANAHGEQL